MTRERFKVIINNLQFSYNEEAVPREHPDHGQIFKIRQLMYYLNECFPYHMEPKVEQSLDEHMVEYKDKNILKQHIKNNPIKWWFKMMYRCIPKTGIL